MVETKHSLLYSLVLVQDSKHRDRDRVRGLLNDFEENNFGFKSLHSCFFVSIKNYKTHTTHTTRTFTISSGLWETFKIFFEKTRRSREQDCKREEGRGSSSSSSSSISSLLQEHDSRRYSQAPKTWLWSYKLN
jgi:hypothetical protein